MTAAEEILPLLKTVTPADEAAVARAVREAYEAGTPVYPIGGGTRLDYGARPNAPGLGLSLARLDGVIDHAVDDMTITVEAGITVAKLAKRLAAQRQRLPVDVRRPSQSTLGGVVARGAAGPRRYAFGTIRDYVIGLRAVDGRGTAFGGGGRVVKNAAGYNLCRMMAGSLGTLGVITRVTLMVRPLPGASALVACDVEDFDAAEKLLAGLVHSQTRPTAVELLAGPARQDTPGMTAMPSASVARLCVGFEGSELDVQWMVEQISDEWRPLGVKSTMAVGAGEADRLWDWLSDFPAQIQIGVLPGAAVEVTRRLLQLDVACSVQAHAGDGLIHVALPPLEPGEFGPLLDAQIRPLVAQNGGNVVVTSWPDGAELTRRDIWGPPGAGATVARALKDRFDPKGLLNPGRFLETD